MQLCLALFRLSQHQEPRLVPSGCPMNLAELTTVYLDFQQERFLVALAATPLFCCGLCSLLRIAFQELHLPFVSISHIDGVT